MIVLVKEVKFQEKVKKPNKKPTGWYWTGPGRVGECWEGRGWKLPRANRLEKSVSVRRKRPSLSLFSQESRFLEDCLSLKALTSRLFSSRLLVLCKKPVA